jgi:hypothetical protein
MNVSKRDDERSQHELSRPASATGSTGAADLTLANDNRITEAISHFVRSTGS